ncbi:EF hand family protein [Cryptosporidium andersoni]|uniref:EF hand family protein n=1 Tax=Cryptosporidium andersoni TaxID=117008 RepID=A0A1J4MPA6_9CRYT|nr:EF hand family protein [Cryptosporidium andersoni]
MSSNLADKSNNRTYLNDQANIPEYSNDFYSEIDLEDFQDIEFSSEEIVCYETWYLMIQRFSELEEKTHTSLRDSAICEIPPVGMMTARFFRTSGLSREILRQIWSIVDIHNRGILNFNEFGVACRLIALYQYEQKYPNSSIYNKIPLKLPFFDISSLWNSKNLESRLESTYNSLQNNGNTTTYKPNPLLLTKIQIENYIRIFRNLDKNSDGLIERDDVFNFLVKSQIPRPDLLKIWDLADTDADGKLSMLEFLIAVAYIELKLQTNEVVYKPLSAKILLHISNEMIKIQNILENRNIEETANKMKFNNTAWNGNKDVNNDNHIHSNEKKGTNKSVEIYTYCSTSSPKDSPSSNPIFASKAPNMCNEFQLDEMKKEIQDLKDIISNHSKQHETYSNQIQETNMRLTNLRKQRDKLTKENEQLVACLEYQQTKLVDNNIYIDELKKDIDYFNNLNLVLRNHLSFEENDLKILKSIQENLNLGKTQAEISTLINRGDDKTIQNYMGILKQEKNSYKQDILNLLDEQFQRRQQKHNILFSTNEKTLDILNLLKEFLNVKDHEKSQIIQLIYSVLNNLDKKGDIQTNRVLDKGNIEANVPSKKCESWVSFPSHKRASNYTLGNLVV